jgi:hypothetical protein
MSEPLQMERSVCRLGQWWPGQGLLLGGVLLAGCGSGDKSQWDGVQTASMAVPPAEDPEPRVVPPVEIVLSGTKLIVTADGFFMNEFSLGPIAGFYCHSPQTTIRYAGKGQLPLPVALDAFDCYADDGRVYSLGGQGTADDRSLYFVVSVRAWLDHDYQATLSFANQFVRHDLGSLPDGGSLPPPSVEGDAGAEPFSGANGEFEPFE